MMRFGLISDDRRGFGFTGRLAVSDTASNVDALDFIFLYATSRVDAAAAGVFPSTEVKVPVARHILAH